MTEAASELQVYSIPAVNMTRLQEEIEKMNKRAAKLRCPPIKLTVIETYTVKKKNLALNFEYEEVYHRCTVEGEAPKLNGWTLVAVLEPQPNAEMLVREVPGQTCPKRFRQTNLRCDHCEKVRRRNAVYVLKRDDDLHKQVGKQCLADFLGHTDPESLVAGAEYLMDFAKLAKDAEDEGWGGLGKRAERVVAINEFVAVASICLRRLGWVPRSQKDTEYDYGDDSKMPTADIAWQVCTQPNEKYTKELIEKKNLVAEGRDIELAHQAVEWASKIDPMTAESTYMHDLGVCCRQASVTWKTHGFVASVVNAYNRHLMKQIAKETPKKASQHVGKEGERQTFAGLKCVGIHPYMSGPYQKTLFRFTDEHGNVLVWKASGQPDWVELNKEYNVLATVKKHDAYNSVPQTIIERVKPCQLTGS